MIFPQQHNLVGPPGSLDGEGAGDHDQPYRFGWRPRASVPFPFNTRQYARLLVLRGRLQDQQLEVRLTSRFPAQVAVSRTSSDSLRRGPVMAGTFSAEALGDGDTAAIGWPSSAA
jgi:hypothetical protein